MHACLYKSLEKADTCVCLEAHEDFARLPEPLHPLLSLLQYVPGTNLTPERKLAREHAAVLRGSFVLRGSHVQFLPVHDREPMTSDCSTDA